MVLEYPRKMPSYELGSIVVDRVPGRLAVIFDPKVMREWTMGL